MRSLCISGYEWPKELINCIDVLNALHRKIDIEVLDNILNTFDRKEQIIVTFLSKEYLALGKLWISMLHILKIKQYIIISADDETKHFLDSLNVLNCKVQLHDDILFANLLFKSKTGFTAKGLAITSLKYPTVKLLLEEGYNVLLMDVDALLIKKPLNEYFFNIDVAFQRIIYFPEAISKVWGFAACSGFVWFRSNNKTLDFVNNTIKVQREVYSDQIALNVALWESDIHWSQLDYNAQELSEAEFNDRINIFKSQAYRNIDGFGKQNEIKLRALSPILFWRNDFIDFDFSKAILFHPNSPKEIYGKLTVFKKYKIINN